jgi:plastocyanin
MKKNLFIGVMALALALFPIMTIAQTVHNVIVGPGFTYTPASLSISVGDIVTWTSEGGTHDVNFALNSITGDAFANAAEVTSLPIQGAGSMGSITFDIPGSYDYDCSVGQHAANGMVGSISVTQPAIPLLITTTVCSDATSVAMTGPWWEWDPNAGPVAVDNGDETWTFTFDPAPTDNMEYLLVVDGVQEDLVSAGAASDDWSCTPVTDYYSYANRKWTVGTGNVSNTFGSCGACIEEPEPEPEPEPLSTSSEGGSQSS